MIEDRFLKRLRKKARKGAPRFLLLVEAKDDQWRRGSCYYTLLYFAEDGFTVETPRAITKIKSVGRWITPIAVGRRTSVARYISANSRAPNSAGIKFLLARPTNRMSEDPEIRTAHRRVLA
jgi:hypothetical protein